MKNFNRHSLLAVAVSHALFAEAAGVATAENTAGAAAALSAAQLAEANAATLKTQIDVSKIPHPSVQSRPFNFHFKVEKLTKEEKEAGKEPQPKRPTVSLSLPVPTLEGVIKGMQDPVHSAKIQEYILELLSDEVQKQARLQVADEKNPVNKQDQLDISKLTLAFLANIPKAERTGGGIAKEVWELFAEDYKAVMPAVTGKDAEKIENASKLLLAKFQPIKREKKAIAFLKDQLALWFTNTKPESQEEFKDCYAFLDEKADSLLAADDDALLNNL